MPHNVQMSEGEKQRLLDWWEATEKGTAVVKRLVSYITELRLHPESSRADGMILFYRAASEVSYGYAGMRGCIRRAFTPEYSEFLRHNIVRCHSFANKTEQSQAGAAGANQAQTASTDTAQGATAVGAGNEQAQVAQKETQQVQAGSGNVKQTQNSSSTSSQLATAFGAGISQGQSSSSTIVQAQSGN